MQSEIAVVIETISFLAVYNLSRLLFQDVHERAKRITDFIQISAVSLVSV